MKEKKDDIKLSRQRDVEILVLVLFLTYIAVSMFDLIPFEWGYQVTLIAEMMMFLVVALPAVVAYRLQGKDILKLFEFQKKEIVYIVTMLAVKLVFVLLFNALKLQPIGMTQIQNPINPIILLFYHVLFVGFCEEFIFRFYIQETLENWFGRYSAAAPFVSAIIFALYHLITGYMMTAVIAFFMGLLWGYVRYFKRDCGLVALAITHGLSNYLIYILAVINWYINGESVDISSLCIV